MFSVASLLNPIKPEPRGTRLPSSPSTSRTSSHGSPAPSIKKAKMTKDGAVFTKGNKIKGEVNYPPFENFDEYALQQMAKFEIYPLGKIQEYPRHIPYNSEKKSFLEKTGRESIEVFQYTYRVPGDEKDYTVMWDYNVGLVRITPFFKCLGHSKTTPAKMLNQNPGLKEITHSITGGALAAQGYWMPYHCALSICTTFCATISPALMPLFGPSFPSQCVPEEAPEYKRMIIPVSLTIAATSQAETYRLQHASSSSSHSHGTSTSASNPSSISRSPSTFSSSMSVGLGSPMIPSRSVDAGAGNKHGNLGTGMNMRKLRMKRSAYDSPSHGYETTTSNSSTTSHSDREYFHTNGTTATGASQYSGSPSVWNARNLAACKANSAISINGVGPGVGNGVGAESGGMGMTGPSPYLSAIPRSINIPSPPIIHSSSTIKHRDREERRSWRPSTSNPPCNPNPTPGKRRLKDLEPETETATGEQVDEDYDGEESSIGSAGGCSNSSVRGTGDRIGEAGRGSPDSGTGNGDGNGREAMDVDVDRLDTGEEKKAAWLLMKLSVKDGEVGGGVAYPGNGTGGDRDRDGDADAPRVKRRRATSY